MGCLGSKQAGDCCDEDPPSKPPIKPSPPRPAKQTGKIQDPPGPPVAPFAALKPLNPVYNVAGVQGALPPGGDRPATQLQGARLQSTPQGLANVEETIVSVAEQREEWMSCIESGDLTPEHADTVLDGAEKLVHLFRNACGNGQQRDAAIPHIQSLQLPKRTALEEVFAKYSALGQVAIDLAGPALEGLSALPFLNPAAAVLGALYARAAKAAQLSQNCGKLLDLMKSVDAQLARVLDSLGRRGEQPPPDVENALKELLDQIVQGGRLMQDYTQRGFVLRFILSKGDERRFAELDKGIHHSMQITSFCVSMGLLAEPQKYQPDESASLRAAVCAAADMPEDRAEEALRLLAKSNPGRLKDLVQQHGNFSVQVLSAEVDSIAERVEVLESKVARLEQQIARAASRQEQDTQLEAYLNDWWKQTMGERKKSVSVDDFFKKLISWFKGNGLLSVLLEYEEEVEEHCSKEMLEAASRKIYLEEGGRVLSFLTFVVLPLLDANSDGKVAYKELLGLQVTAQECALSLGESKPSALVDMLNVIFRGFDEDAVFKKAHYTASTPEIALVSQALKVTPMLQNYGVHLLLESHVPGTRQWLFDRVNKWLETAPNAGEDAGTLNHRRMFLLLAGPGMGKSVFSAVMEKKLEVKMQAGQRLVLVRHFFKVGEPRAQGKAMVLCLALQLAEQLPGMAALLWLVAKEHGSADQLTLKDTFDKYLMEPLAALDKEHSVEQPVVVMLLDAIDEATDGAAGCEPVTHLVGHQMSKLPAWVKIVLTGRPQMESCFRAWEPEWIQPSAHENTEDMHKLLVAWLQQDGRIVSPSDFEPAVEVMLRKSEGQFIWAKFAFDQLRGKVGCWTPAEMEAELPSGLSGMYRHIMEVLQDALREENPDALTLLRQQLLPILVATKSPLTPQQLTVITGAEQHQVDLLLRLLVNMFPVRLHSGSLKVVPYHKSVLDWLVEDPQFSVDAGQGHECLGKACFAAVLAARTSPSKLANGGGLEAVSSSQPSGSILEYALRFGVTHLCLAQNYVKLLEDLILDFCGLWPMAFAQGCGNGLLKDLIALGPTTSAVVKDVVRWLRLTSSYLSVHPRAALQLACDSPCNSVVAKHANSLPEQPQAKLVTREHDWHACLSTLKGHDDNVTSVAVSAGAIVSGSEDNEVRVWDLESGTCKATLAGHSRDVTSVAISSDARICVSGSDDETLKVWDLESGTCKATLAGHCNAVTSVAVSSDARTCVSGSRDETLRVWDLESGTCKATLAGHTDSVTSIAVSSDAGICVSGSCDKTLRVWDLESRTCKATLAGHSSVVECIAFSPDARICVSGSDDKTLRVWDLESGACKATLAGYNDSVQCVAVSSDARTCVSGSFDKTIRVWDLESGTCKATLAAHSDSVQCVAVSSDARTCVSGSCDRTLRVWDLESGTCKATLAGHSAHVNRVAASSDAGICVSGSNDKTLRVWDLESGTCKATLAGHSNSVTSVAVSPDAGICVSGSYDKTLRVWDLESGMCKATLAGHSNWVCTVTVSPDARTCVSGSLDNILRVWDLESGTCKATLAGHSNAVTSVAVSSDARTCVSGSCDKTLRVWDLESRTCKATLSGHSRDVTSIVVSSDARTCVSGSWDMTLRVWDLESRTCKATLAGHSSVVECIAVSPDARICVSGSDDETLRKWDITTGEQLACFRRDSEEGAQLQALADSWRFGCNLTAAAGDGAAGNDVVWVGCCNEQQSIRWRIAEAGRSSIANPAIAYLMPPICIGHGPFYNKSSHRVSFFDAVSDQFICYQLAV